ncbi:MAG TPA: YfhO family protein, partial [Thermoanaerobaculia bacterium]|nr:YfhO family protein [Thermoanaerobaculia bacterium]
LAYFASVYTNPDPRLRDTMLSKTLTGPRWPLVFQSPSLEIRLNRGYRPRAEFRDHQGSATVLYPADSTADIDVFSQSGGLVVLHDTFAEGWTAAVDGQPVEIRDVNVLSRGVVVGPGHHRIAMQYMPPGLVLGACGAGITVLLLALLRVRRPRSE